MARTETISAAFPWEKRTAAVFGSGMTYVDEGSGPIVLFLHGNPTSSYLWRNIFPYLLPDHRVIVPDLIGMGDSQKPDLDYTFLDHARYLEAFIEQLKLRDVVLVVHDWGSALGMRYARLNSQNVRAFCFMEAIIPPLLPAAAFDDLGEKTGKLFRDIRTPGKGEKMVLDQNFFVEVMFAKLGVVRPMKEDEMDAYRSPFPTPSSRKPTLVWPRQIPIGGQPHEVVAEIEKNADWLFSSPIPKLLFHVEPGALIPPEAVHELRKKVPYLVTVNLGRGAHFLQEDHPHEIGRVISSWMENSVEHVTS